MKQLVLCIALLSGCLLTQAQEKNQSLDEVVVTATKFDKKQSETGKVITIIDSAMLAHSEGKSLAQLLGEQSGVVVNGGGSNPGKDKALYLRGAGMQYTLILINGIPVNDPSGNGGIFDLRMLSLDQVARIEILKGGQSTLYGSDAVAGVINIITKSSKEYPIGIYGTVSAGSYSSFKQNAGIKGNVQGFGYNVSYTHNQDQGFSEANDSTGKAGFDNDGTNLHSVNADFDFMLTDKWKLQPFFRFSDYHGKYDAGGFTDSKDEFFSKHYQTGFSSTYAIDDGGIHVNYSFENTSREYQSQYAGLYDGSLNYLDVYVNKNFGDHFQWVGGVNSSKTSMKSDGVSEDSAHTDLFSIYGSAFLRNLGGFNLELGGRYNHHNEAGNNLTFTINPSFRIGERYELFVNVSSAFRAPTLNMLYGRFGANTGLRPEQSRNYEAGLSAYPLPEKYLNARVTFFKRNIRDVITYTDHYINLDKQNDKGAEVELSYKRDRFNVKAFYNYLEGAVTTRNNGKDSTYNNLLRRPHNTFGLSAGYQCHQFYASVNLRSYGSRMDLDFNTYPSRMVSLDAYYLLDAYAEYAFFENRLKLFVDAKNLLNTSYEEIYGYNTMGFNIQAGIHFDFHKHSGN